MPADCTTLTGLGTKCPAFSGPIGCPRNDGLLESAGNRRGDRSGRHYRGRVFRHRLGLGPIPSLQGRGTESRGEQMPESCTSHLLNSLSSMEALSFNAGYPSTNLCLGTSRSHLGARHRAQGSTSTGRLTRRNRLVPERTSVPASASRGRWKTSSHLVVARKSLPVRPLEPVQEEELRSFGSFTSSPGVGGT